MDCHDGIVQMHVSERNYEVDFLELEDDYDPPERLLYWNT